MGTSTESWRLKLARAQVHLDELSELLLPYRETDEYRMTETTEQKGILAYRAWSQVVPNPLLAVVLGDVLFNVRSALDHLAVALVPAKREYRASFPILIIDPELVHSNDVKGDADRRQIWEKATAGMSSAAVAIIRRNQPFSIPPALELSYVTLVPDDAVLYLLSRFQNADKHRRLITTAQSLVPTAINVRLTTGEWLSVALPNFFPNQSAYDGAVVFRSDTEVHVQAEGSTQIAAGISKKKGGPYRKLPDFPVELLRTVSEIATLLEGCM